MLVWLETAHSRPFLGHIPPNDVTHRPKPKKGHPWTEPRFWFRFWASEEAIKVRKFPHMGDSLPRTPMNYCAKFDADIFILGGEIRNRTNI